MKNFISLFFLVILVCAVFGCKKQLPDADTPVPSARFEKEKSVDFKKAAAIKSSYDTSSKTLAVTVSLIPDVHAYAPGETIGKPVGLVVLDKNNWKVTGEVQIPAGRPKQLESSETSVVLEGEFVLTAKVEGGDGPISAELALQICTDYACDRPRIHSITVDSRDKNSL